VVLAVIGVAAYLVVPRVMAKLRAQRSAAAGQNKVQIIPVVAEPVTHGNINQYLYEPGTVTPYSTVTVRTRVDGQIMKIYFTEGQMVKENDPLIEIDPRPYEVQLTQAKGQFAHDAALLIDAKLDLQRYESLLATAAIAQQQIDTQKALVQQYEGTLKADQGQIDSATLNITYCHITSPITGKIGLRLVDLGNLVHATDTAGLVTITQLQPITVVFTIPQSQIQRVFSQPDHGQGLTVEAWTQDRTKKLAVGKLQATDSQVDPTTETLKLKASFDNDDFALFPNLGVEAKLLVDTLKNVVIVPHVAVQNGPEFVYAFVIKKDDKGNDTADMRQIQVVTTEGEKTVVESGVAPGEMVVTDNIDKLTQGTPVKVRPPAGKTGKGAATQGAATQGSKGMAGGQHHKPSTGDAAGPAPTTKEAAE
jgi:multidrug efflux system membrane fusion protein